MIQEFVASYARLLVRHPEAIQVEIAPIDEGFDEITIFANDEDVGKLIGREGRMINSIKTVISGCKAKGGKNYRVNVKSATQNS
jgi:predicted RNA-binding protein YlqC (UPF0109 family)